MTKRRATLADRESPIQTARGKEGLDSSTTEENWWIVVIECTVIM
jgi:hypothetical protein